MPFKVCRVSGGARLDSLPVAVIKNYPLELRDYKPYAQCNICLDENNLLLRMWAFEVSPPQGSELRAVFYLFPHRPDTALHVVIRPGGECEIALCANGIFTTQKPPDGFRLRPHNGEDLQGVYWGGLAHLPLSWLDSLADGVGLSLGGSFLGNFYKLCEGPVFAHKGSYFPADYQSGCFGKKSMGEFLVVSY